jgi:D-glycero-beta-D-manno-heptose 1-phosphate adenylyltransferase
MSMLYAPDFFGPGVNFSKRFITDENELLRLVSAVRDLGYIVGLTQGGYDIVHVGHGDYLELAKLEGNKLAAEKGMNGCILVVAVDTDNGLDWRKSTPTSKRPIVPQNERAKMVAYLKPVDLVTLDERCYPQGHERQGHSQFHLLELLKPELYIASKGSYTEQQITQISAHAGAVAWLEEQATTSTTGIIRGILVGLEGEIQATILSLMAHLQELFTRFGGKVTESESKQ